MGQEPGGGVSPTTPYTLRIGKVCLSKGESGAICGTKSMHYGDLIPFQPHLCLHSFIPSSSEDIQEAVPVPFLITSWLSAKCQTTLDVWADRSNSSVLEAFPGRTPIPPCPLTQPYVSSRRLPPPDLTCIDCLAQNVNFMEAETLPCSLRSSQLLYRAWHRRCEVNICREKERKEGGKLL